MKKFSYFVSGGLLGVTLVSGLVLSCKTTKADESHVSDIDIIVPTSCEITTTASGQDAYSDTVNNGIYDDNIGDGGVTSVFCNDTGGFAVYAVGFTGDVDNGADHTKLIGTNTGQKIVTGTATGSNSDDPSNWAMKLQSSDSNITINNGYSNYSYVPDTYTKVATFTSSTTIFTGYFTPYYAVFINSAQTADTYVGKVKYTVLHPSTSTPNSPQDTNGGYIGYYPNANGNVTDTMGDQPVDSSDTSATLWASNFKRQGYGFAGWSDKYDWVLGADDGDGNGTGVNAGYHIYGPNEDITFTAGEYDEEGLSLYAVWVKSVGIFQNWTGCNALDVGEVTALTDLRDNDTYAVAKLADEKCWMIENLRLDTAGSNDSTKAQGFGGVFSGLANPEVANFSDSSIANSLYYKNTPSGSATINVGSNDFIPRYNNSNTASGSVVSNMTSPSNDGSYEANVYSYGNYYNHPAARASTLTSTGLSTSLCPKGWRLPYGTSLGNGNTPGGFYYLNYSINNNSNVTDSTASSNLRSYPNNYIYSGLISDSSVSNRGSGGTYWSTTIGLQGRRFILSLSSSSVDPGTNYSSGAQGFSVRCVFDN